MGFCPYFLHITIGGEASIFHCFLSLFQILIITIIFSSIFCTLMKPFSLLVGHKHDTIILDKTRSLITYTHKINENTFPQKNGSLLLKSYLTSFIFSITDLSYLSLKQNWNTLGFIFQILKLIHFQVLHKEFLNPAKFTSLGHSNIPKQLFVQLCLPAFYIKI